MSGLKVRVRMIMSFNIRVKLRVRIRIRIRIRIRVLVIVKAAVTSTITVTVTSTITVSLPLMLTGTIVFTVMLTLAVTIRATTERASTNADWNGRAYLNGRGRGHGSESRHEDERPCKAIREPWVRGLRSGCAGWAGVWRGRKWRHGGFGGKNGIVCWQGWHPWAIAMSTIRQVATGSCIPSLQR